MKINKELMKGSTSILILTLLKSEDMYGYQITQKEWNVFKKAMNSIIGEECYE